VNSAATPNRRFLDALAGKPVDRTPIWMMRQAGRYLPEYRAVREKLSFLDLCHTPEKAAEVTIQPIDRFGFDAAILFSDIMIPIEAMGVEVAFAPGPVIAKPVRTRERLAELRRPDIREATPFVFETVKILARELESRVPLIGFAGAPWTAACYLIEGKGSKTWERAKGLAFSDPALTHDLLDLIAQTTADYLIGQAAAGASALMLFDSWAGALGPGDYEAIALRHAKTVLDRVRAESKTPLIYFPHGAMARLASIRECGADAIGIDWTISLADARAKLGDAIAVQGNLDNTAMFAPEAEIRRRTRAIIDDNAGRPGHIFNLGHGLLPDTPIAAVEWVIDELRR
jgi:uroporphyrinogen decarboxylase